MTDRSGVYLAGAITGLTYQQALGWRVDAARRLTALGYDVYSPMRHKLQLADAFDNKALPHTSSAFRNPFQRDLYDIRRCDVILADLGEAPDVGPNVGTMVELGYAFGLGKYIIVVDQRLNGTWSPVGQVNASEYPGTYRLHPFIEGVANDVLPSLDDAISLLAEYRPLRDGDLDAVD